MIIFIGGSLKCVEHLIDSLTSLTAESMFQFPISQLSSERQQLKGTAYECAKAITRSNYCIEFEGVSKPSLLITETTFQRLI